MGVTSILKIGCRIVYKGNVYLVFDIDKNNNIYCEGPRGLIVLEPNAEYYWYEDWVVQNINYLIKKEKSRDANGKNNEM